MSQKALKTKRKRPRQARSKATVEAIVEASAQVLVSHGYSRMTTTRVAERAGVSVGTLYQYFRDKESLVRELWARHEAEVFGAMGDAVAATVGESARPRIEAVLGAVLRAKGARPGLTMALAATMGELDGPAHLVTITAKTQSAVSMMLAEHSDELVIEDTELTTFLIVNAIEGVISGVIATRPEDLGDPALVSGLTKMLYRFVGGEG